MFLDIENGEDFIERNSGFSDSLVNAGEALNRAEESADIPEESDERADVDLAANDEVSTVTDRSEARGSDDNVGSSSVAGVDADAAADNAIGFIDVAEKAALLDIFHGETADGENAGKNFVE